jgi:hypothetical protein
MGDLRAEHAPAAPVGRGHPRHFLTLADACSIAVGRGGVCLSDTYAGPRALMRWRCGAGHEWSAAFGNVRAHGTWCPQCAGVAPLSLADAQSAAAMRGGVCLSDAYTNNRTPLLWRCGAGHEWSSTFKKIRTQDTWCPQCAGNAPLSLADAQSAAAMRGGVCVSDTYSNNKTPLRWRCGAGHEWDAPLDTIRTQGSWCPQCAGCGPLSLADAQAAAAKRGGVCLSDTYANRMALLRWRCASGHEWSAPLRSVRNDGTWCARCARRGRLPLTLADAQAAAVKLGGVCLSDPLARMNGRTPLRWRCAAGHEWRAPLAKIRNSRQWCQRCAKAADQRPRNHRRAAKHA